MFFKNPFFLIEDEIDILNEPRVRRSKEEENKKDNKKGGKGKERNCFWMYFKKWNKILIQKVVTY